MRKQKETKLKERAAIAASGVYRQQSSTTSFEYVASAGANRALSCKNTDEDRIGGEKTGAKMQQQLS
jgi:hypothetical protein